MFKWNESTIKFRGDAARFVGYDWNIASRIIPYISKTDTLCDVGCGLGYLAFVLARYCKHVTAIDNSPLAIEMAKKGAKERKIENISIIQKDLFFLDNTDKFDVVTFCSVGRTDEILKTIEKSCSGKAVIIKKDWSQYCFSTSDEAHHHCSYVRTCAELDASGIKYETSIFPLDMGQPFRNLGDVDVFLNLYKKSDCNEKIKNAIIKTDSKEFPYYIPMERLLGLIVIDMQTYK